MTSQRYHLTLFGRDTAAALQHLQLGASLRRLYTVCATTPTARAEVRWQIAKLKRNMAGHFAVEESDDCFGAVQCESPSLAAQVDELRAEHLSMLQIAEHLWSRSENLDDCSELAATVKLLIERFHAHERAEVALMRRFLCDEAIANAG
jgi:iron-sulfur cluster repair protein YtfE (RIC family)